MEKQTLKIENKKEYFATGYLKIDLDLDDIEANSIAEAEEKAIEIIIDKFGLNMQGNLEYDYDLNIEAQEYDA